MRSSTMVDLTNVVICMHLLCSTHLIQSVWSSTEFVNVEFHSTSPNGTSLDNSQEVKLDIVSTVKASYQPFSLQPLAAGGIGLLCGLFGIFTIIGVFILITKRNSEFVYEQARTADTIEHI